MEQNCHLMIKMSKAHLLELKSCAKHRQEITQYTTNSCLAKIQYIITEVIQSSSDTIRFILKIKP